jgi:uncharacterized repeat protein (TIGR03847 family)
MADANNNLGPASAIEAVSIGEAGNRLFHIKISGQNGNAIVWIEKEQLNSVIIAFERILYLLETEYKDSTPKMTNTETANIISKSLFETTEFTSGNWSLKYDTDLDLISLWVDDINKNDGDNPHLNFQISALMAERFTSDAMEIYTGGRPVCPLCNAPLIQKERHHCPRSNGYAKILQ